MDDNWTQGPARYDLVGACGGLAARLLDGTDRIVTNGYPPTGSFFALWTLGRFGPDELTSEDADKTGGHLHFPYGWPVEAP